MPKSTFFTGQPLFSQVLNLIPSEIIERAVRKYKANHYCKSFFATDHLVSMLYASLFQVTSIRELITGMQASNTRLLHLGVRNTPRRSTLSDANARRSADFFEQIYHDLVKTFLSDSRGSKGFFIIDSSTITLFSEVMKGAGANKSSGKRKGGVKVHALVSAEHDIPAFVRLTEAREQDVTQLRHISLPEGSVIVMDKGYNSYEQFRHWGDKIIWVTRLRENGVVEHLSSREVDEQSARMGVLTDDNIKLGFVSWTKGKPPFPARLITFFDHAGQREFQFITNDLNARPETVAQYYKQRWQIELLFKRIKQRYPLRYFLGETPNAIKIQIWCALICDLLVTIIKKRLEKTGGIKWSYANLSAMIKHHLMNYINMFLFLKNPEKALLKYRPPTPQMQLQGLIFEKRAN
jgi:hypothetical protein